MLLAPQPLKISTELLGKWFKITIFIKSMFFSSELLGKWFKILNFSAFSIALSELLGKWFKFRITKCYNYIIN